MELDGISEEYNHEPEREYSSKALKDFELIDQAVAGDERAFGVLMSRYKNSVYYMLLKMVKNHDDAEDLTIEAFTKAFKNLPNFKKDYTFSTWLFRIATNNCIDFIRRKKIDTMSIHVPSANEKGETSMIDLKDNSLNPQDDAISKQKMQMVREVVETLPYKYKKLVHLRYFQELSYEEISEKTDIPLGTVKAQLHRARELLFDILKKNKDFI
jgi:RNA polymerase sigma-70 factor (ECF subfamily)